MDTSSDEVYSSSACSDDNSREASSLSTDLSEGSSPTGSQNSNPRCRKSSRLRAKMEKQAQNPDPGDPSDAYNLRLSSLVKRVQVERNRSTPKQPKGKSKPPPLSKYRRRTANARERMRMKDINEGFENLRQCLPDMEVAQGKGKKKESPTKFTVLSLAINYIHALRDILGYPPLDTQSSVCARVGVSLGGETNSSESASGILSAESDSNSYVSDKIDSNNNNTFTATTKDEVVVGNHGDGTNTKTNKTSKTNKPTKSNKTVKNNKPTKNNKAAKSAKDSKSKNTKSGNRASSGKTTATRKRSATKSNLSCPVDKMSRPTQQPHTSTIANISENSVSCNAAKLGQSHNVLPVLNEQTNIASNFVLTSTHSVVPMSFEQPLSSSESFVFEQTQSVLSLTNGQSTVRSDAVPLVNSRSILHVVNEQSNPSSDVVLFSQPHCALPLTNDQSNISCDSVVFAHTHPTVHIPNERSNLSSDSLVFAHTHHALPLPNEELCSQSSPISTGVVELKEYEHIECTPLFLPSSLHADFNAGSKHLTRCHDPLPGSAILMEFRAEARSSPSSSSASDPSLSPSPPPLPLPEDCMDLDQSDFLDVSISLPALEEMDIVL